MRLNWEFVLDLKWLEMGSVIRSLTLKNACMMVENATFQTTLDAGTINLWVDKNKDLDYIV